MSFVPESADPVVCRCLDITVSEISAAGEFGGCQTLSDVKVMTAAGSGCMSCHRRIIALLERSRRPASMEAAAAPQA